MDPLEEAAGLDDFDDLGEDDSDLCPRINTIHK